MDKYGRKQKLINRLIFLATIFSLSFVRIPVEELGSFILLDGVSLLYFLVNPGRLKGYLQYFGFLLVCAVGASIGFFVTGAYEFQFVGRLGLIVLDACLLVSVFNSHGTRKINIGKDQFILMAVFGYLAAAFVWALLPDESDPIFYFNSPKPWVATFPALIVVYYLLLERYRFAVIVGLGIAVFSMLSDISSRSLLLQASLLMLFATWKENKALASFLFLMALSFFYFSSGFMEAAVTLHEHSNTFRQVMILQIFDFSPAEWVFGRGIDAWRNHAFAALYDLPGAEEFFENANPHFFPAELIIRGGLVFFLSVAFLLYRALKKSPNWWVVICMLIGTCVTTNTGVERLYMSLALFLAIDTPVKFLSFSATRKVQQQISNAATAT